MRFPGHISLSLIAACAVAAPLLAGPSSASAAFGDRILRQGMKGADVKALQRKLTKLDIETDVDGYFGRQTKRSVKRYERRNDRNVNGVCSRADARHIQRLLRTLRDVEDDPSGDDPNVPELEYGTRKLGPGDEGSDVRRLQRLLSKQGLKTPADGVYGKTTTGNVKRWEAWRYTRADGRVSRSQAKKIRKLANSGANYVLREHVFPVRGPHDYGGAGSRFGAPRSGHRHKGQDVAAKAGTKIVAVHAGRVAARQYQADGAGHYVVIHGRDRSDSVYMHLIRRAIVRKGERVLAGEKIGEVGSTGGSSGPHLHFELWTPHWFDGGEPYDPLPKLKRWDRKT